MSYDVIQILKKKVIWLACKGMKLGSLNGLKGKQLSLTLVIIFTTSLIWKWERIPHQDPFHQQQEQDLFPQGWLCYFVCMISPAFVIVIFFTLMI